MAADSSNECSATDADSHSPDELVVNLQVVSPSVGVTRPLLFPSTSASTTIKQLKEKIREALPLRPADEHQRLIHRGRALMRENDKLIDIFGAEALQKPDQHTIHLVLRDLSDNRPSSTPAAPPTSHQNPTPTPTIPQRQQPAHGPYALPEQHGFLRRPAPPQSAPPVAHQQPPAQPPTQPQIPATIPIAQQLPEPAATVFQQQHQQLTAWLSQIQRDAMARAIVNQNQRGRAQGGMRGIGDNAAEGNGTRDPSSGRASPAPTHTVYREVHGHNGQSYHVETMIRPSTQTAAPSQGGENAPGAQHGFRASSGPPQGPIGAAMQRSASGASMHGRSFAQPGVTLPMPYSGGSRPGSGRATPDPASISRSVPGILNMFTSAPQTASSSQAVELYLLSSPEGPRGVLINNATLETFYTPRANPVEARSYSPPRVPGLRFFDRPELEGRNEPPNHRQQNQMEEPQLGQPQAPANEPQGPAPVPQGLHPNNGAALGVQPLLIAIMSYIWQVIRIGFFVWMFTSADVSWGRWIVVLSVAVAILAAGAGYLAPIAEFLGRPVNRRMEHIFAGLEHPDGQRRRRRRPTGAEPDPADMAARLTAEQERRQTTLGRYYRMVKRVGILFVASIAPGVAERQIALLEMEARLEERRQQEAEARAREQATAAEAANTEGEGNTEETEQGANTDPSAGDGATREENRTSPTPSFARAGEDGSGSTTRNNDQPPAQEPLVEL